MQTLIHHATLVLAEEVVEDGWLLIENERVAAIGQGTAYPHMGATEIDARSALLLPGLIDLHCDAIEKLVEPRPNVFFDLHMAFREADWRLAGCGITTEFHAVSLDDGEFGVRSDTFVRELFETIRDETSALVRHRLHTRLELSSQRGYQAILQMIEQQQTHLVSIMDHSPGRGQFVTEQAFRDYQKKAKQKSEAEITELLALKMTQMTAIPARIAEVTQRAHAAGLTIAAHDDDTCERVQQWPGLQVGISEFPTTMEAATCAHNLGLAVCMGAPNVLRGKSSSGNLSALAAIQAGVVDVLCSDYYPAALLWSILKLAEQRVLTLPQATQLATLRPASAIGLGHDYGSLDVGKMADLILVDPHTKTVQRVFVGGSERVHRV